MIISIWGIFSAAAALIWLSTFGYVFFLQALRLFRRRAESGKVDLPSIAVVVPTLNEQEDIREKLKDLRRSDYPADLVRRVVVDGGSTDRTTDIIRREAAEDERLLFIHLPDARSKADQVRTVLERLEEEVVVFTDADSRLHPSCIRELVSEIQTGSSVALAAAAVRPETRLSEERLHWLFLNHLWWLEGEALSCAGLSGVCYALHRPSFQSSVCKGGAEDIHLGAVACTKGRKVVLSPRARATELRVPRTASEFLKYRRRRGSCYLAELLEHPAARSRMSRWVLARAVRIWQMTGLPWLLTAVLASGTWLLFTRFRFYALAVMLFFPLSAYLYSLALFQKDADALSAPRLAVTLVKYAFLLFLSLFHLDRHPTHQGPRGGDP